MARKQVSDLDCDKTVSFGDKKDKGNLTKGTEIEGYYIGSKELENKGKYKGTSMLHILKTEDGTIGVWGAANLNKKLNSSLLGMKVFIRYDGKVDLPDGNTMKKFNVEYDDEDTTDVEIAQVSFRNDDESDDESGEEIEEGSEGYADDESEEEEEQEEPKAATRQSAPARQAPPRTNAPAQAATSSRDKVNALLNKKRA